MPAAATSPEPAPRVERPAAVVVATTFPGRPGDGTPEFVLTLAKAIRAFDVTVVVPRVPGAPRREVIDGLRIRRVAYFPARWEGLAADAIMPTLRAQPWRWIEAPFLIGALILATWHEVRRRRAVVVNPHWIIPAGVVAFVVRAITRVPYVLTVHGADAYTLRGRIARLVKRLVVARAAAVAPVSTDIARSLDLPRDTPVLRMGVDTQAIRDAVGDRSPEPGLITYIGRLADKKGVDVLIDALAQVPGASADIIGDGPDRSGLEERARQVGVADRMRFRGRLPKTGVLEALRRSNLVVIPSKIGADGDMDGTPVVLCEAMAAGLPVVASELGGLAECVTDGKDGLLVAPDDVGALAKALQRAVDGEVDLPTLGRAAAETAQTTLDIGTVGQAYDGLLARAAGSEPPTDPR